MKMIITIFTAASVLFFTSCKKEKNEIQPGDTGELVVEFDNVVGAQNLQLNTGTYTNAVGESFKITMLNYYISNISLITTSGTKYTLPKDSSYFLVKEEDAATHKITLRNIPAGDYKTIEFVIGVDSLKNAAPVGERTGVLDPAGKGAGMYWTWNSGYIFVKMEGTSDAASSADKRFRYHIGGFGGYSSATINNIKKTQLTAGGVDVAKVRKNKAVAPVIHIMTDASRILNGSTNVSIAANTTVMFNPYSVNIANNYTSMFTIDHIHND